MKKLILILMILFLVTGCGLYDNFAKNKDVENNITENKVNEDKEESYTLTNEQQEKVDRIINLFEPQFVGKKFNDLTDNYKLSLLSSIAISENYKDGYPIVNDETVYLNKRNFEKLTREYFGPDAEVTMMDIYCFCDQIDYFYDGTTETYHTNENHLGHGFSSPIIKRKGEKVVKKGDIVSVKYKTIFSDYVDIGAPTEFYKSLEDYFNYEEPVATFEDYCWGDEMDYECDYDKMFNDIDFNTYSYNFKLDGDNFYFIDYTME